MKGFPTTAGRVKQKFINIVEFFCDLISFPWLFLSFSADDDAKIERRTKKKVNFTFAFKIFTWRNGKIAKGFMLQKKNEKQKRRNDQD